MKKCPTCSKTFEDSMRFCQVDGTPLVDDVPAFDPYATIVAQPKPPAAPAEPPAPVAEPPAPVVETPSPIVEAAPEYVLAEETPVHEPSPVEPVVEETEQAPIIHQTIGSLPIGEPNDLLDLPSADPLKTMHVSEAEMQAALRGMAPEPDVMEIPPIKETPAPEPPSFIAPEIPSTSFGSMEPPPSPFATADNVADQPVQAPVFDEPEPEPAYDEAATMIQPSFTMPAELTPEPEPVHEPVPEPVPAWTPPPTPQPEWTPPPAPAAEWTPPPAPVAEWTPPPAPDASWQNQEIGSNTPFQQPPAGAGGTNNTLGLVSLIVGIVSFVCLYGIGGLVAIVLGLMQRSKIKNNPNEYGGGGLAMAGIILGVINIIAFLGFMILYAGLIFASMR